MPSAVVVSLFCLEEGRILVVVTPIEQVNFFLEVKILWSVTIALVIIVLLIAFQTWPIDLEAAWEAITVSNTENCLF